MRRSGVLFINPRAGSLPPAEHQEVRQAAEDSGLRVVEIRKGIDVAALAREAIEAGEKNIVVAGGDGSVHHVVQALVGTEGILGIVPIGTMNHLARDLDVPVGDWRAALEIAIRGDIRQIDVGSVDGRYFLNSLMLGIYPIVTEYRERFRSVHSRWRAYYKAIRLGLRQFPHVTLVVELDGRVETFRTQLFVIGVNAYDLTQTGILARKSTFNDGRLSIYSLSFMSRFQFVRAAAKYLRGRIGDVDGFRSIRTPQLRIDTGRRRLRLSLDGELCELSTPLRIATVPSALNIRGVRPE